MKREVAGAGRRDGHYQMWSATRVSHRCSCVRCWLLPAEDDREPQTTEEKRRNGTIRLVPSVGSNVQTRKLLQTCSPLRS